MDDFLIGIGVLLAIIGPLLLIPVTWLLHRLIVRPIVKRAKVSAVLSLFIVAVAVTLSYVPGKLEYDRLCTQYATPHVAQRVSVAGFYRTRLYPYEARPFLESGGFRFVEAPHMYEEGKYVRYSRAPDGTISEQVIPAITSAYAVSDALSQLSYGITLNEKRVFERATDRELARAAQVTYEGGPLSLLLGVYAMSSCPDVITPEGSKNFEIYYGLEQHVLGGG
ncbi:MAG: hypothetical protein P8Y95_16325 [Gammaproteobacteria bacterium]|jgi:hypothetical protein